MTQHSITGYSGADQPRPSIYDTCIRCGLCLPSCPTYLETMTETSGPRGRISLIKAVGESRLDLLSAGFVEQMWQCLDCRACEAVCPSGVRYGQLVETARTQIERARASREPARRDARPLLRRLFGGTNLLRNVARLVRFAQHTRLIYLTGLFGAARVAKLAPPIPSEFFVAHGQLIEAPRPHGLAFLHAGCIMPLAFPHVHDATLRMLRRAGLSITV
ncbi:MAG TPA: 4Fe-4S dicluster domain-containing protein, partial [Candidatus Cybelea sp.]